MKNYFIKKVIVQRTLLFVLIIISLTFCSDQNSIVPDNSELISEIEGINFITENYPPFNYEEDGSLHGVSVEILDELFLKMNVNLNNHDVNLLEWSEGYQTTLDTENTMIFSAVRMAEREDLFKWVGPIAPHKDVIISRTNSNLSIDESGDLLNYRIGVIKDYSSIQLLTNYGINESDLHIAENVNELYAMLENGTVDCIAYSEIGHQLIVSAYQLIEADYEFPFVMRVSELYYAFNVNTSSEIINYFQAAFDELRNDRGSDGSSVYDRIISNYNIINESNDGVTDEQVIDLVNQTSSDLTSDTPGTILKINNSESPYRDAVIPALYTFVYDTSLTVVAHAANNLLVGANLKGKPDVSGKMFRDEILAGALNNGTGWVDYIYTKPGQGGLYYKTTYYKLTTGSDGELYIVCAGKYR